MLHVDLPPDPHPPAGVTQGLLQLVARDVLLLHEADDLRVEQTLGPGLGVRGGVHHAETLGHVARHLLELPVLLLRLLDPVSPIPGLGSLHPDLGVLRGLGCGGLLLVEEKPDRQRRHDAQDPELLRVRHDQLEPL